MWEKYAYTDQEHLNSYQFAEGWMPKCLHDKPKDEVLEGHVEN